MQKFLSIHDVSNPQQFVNTAVEFKQNGFPDSSLIGKTVTLVFFNPSLRTRMSTQKAAQEMGMHVQVLNIGSDSWQLEFEEGAIMNGSTAEHIKEAAMVISTYSDIVGIRTFAGLKDLEFDYSDKVLHQFLSYLSVPLISLESAVRHPLQSLADMITIEEHKLNKKPKVVISWAPHVKALPQAVANSFLEWSGQMDYEVHLVRPEEYALLPEFEQYADQIHDNQEDAFKDADFIYVKNWSMTNQYGNTCSKYNDWTISKEKLRNSNQAKIMHCLPVRRNVVIQDEVLDSKNCLIQTQVENRLIAVKTVLTQIQ